MAGGWERQRTDDTVAAKLFTLPEALHQEDDDDDDDVDDGDDDAGDDDVDDDDDDNKKSRINENKQPPVSSVYPYF